MIAAASSTISTIFSKSSSSLSSSSSNGNNSKLQFFNFPPASKIFVKSKDLSRTTGEASLIKLFSKFGHIVEVKVPKHEETNRSMGYAFIQYTCQDDAILAIEQMDDKMVDGRIVHAEIAKPSKSSFGAYPRSSGPPPCPNLEADYL